jgi:hypothetical protein
MISLRINKTDSMALPRGYRNNNPLNIRHSADTFQGEAPRGDTAFKTFKSMAYGFRAGLCIMRSYIKNHSCDTLKRIITRWAPPSENDTAHYIDFVSKQTALLPDEPLKFNKETFVPIVLAMARMENGEFPSDPGDAAKGWDLL